MLTAQRVSVAFVLATLAAACGEQATDPTVETLVSFQVIAGDAQEGLPGQELPDALVVQAIDESDKPLKEVLVNFRVTEGGGTMWAGTAITDKDGFARDYWTLGESGPQRVEVRAIDPTTGERHVHGEFTATLLLPDMDGDGFDTSVDCNDANPSVYPGAPELLDGIDNDCDGQVDEGLAIDADGDGFDTTVDCDDTNPNIHPGAQELPDGIDNDCDGDTDEDIDADGDGYDSTVDCNDGNPNIHPGAVEIADGIDNDCDGQVDEGLFSPDAYEPNNTFGAAANLGAISAGEDLSIDATFHNIAVDTHDYYRIQLDEVSSICIPGFDEPHRLSVTLTTPPGEDYDLYLYLLSGQLVGTSNHAPGATEFIEVTLVGSCGADDSWDVVIEVRSDSGAHVGAYDLEIVFVED